MVVDDSPQLLSPSGMFWSLDLATRVRYLAPHISGFSDVTVTNIVSYSVDAVDISVRYVSQSTYLIAPTDVLNCITGK